MKVHDVATACRLTNPPPWWAGIFAMDARWWLVVVVAALLCRWMILRDLPQLQPEGRMRVGMLWAFSIVVGFGAILCFEAVAAYTGPLFTWYNANLQHLAAQGCPTAGLHATFDHLYRANMTLSQNVASGMWMVFPLVMIVLRRVRLRYVLDSEVGAS